ncbi:lysoplasmalogenase TMEM86A [Lepeophtheirus salmonis]|uniref:lysoplasmalogenase n=1 Tax=Lepeophtheirus salmonis TaxID=72036 RepID=D3PJR5_LEPSM|nr:uncharacterized protein LOC121119335 [Lepeophtheirus salmonis]XP_040569907.1 uncharacterized protein LOC121119335 [Lepeophtheirus salmonis]XP_040569908.1 uncharacterized protein LOC121119335 [Lepeophtheirus salmonis]XP_040569909.1 uncharacterized protein LOC121119335 [Lepeophtheirus salmonis]ADD38801.1 Transmembrane protein 86A [Lepeophtheirus salmonis]
MEWTHQHRKLLPFYFFQIIYWIIRIQSKEIESIESVIIKCLPIGSLLLYGLYTKIQPNQRKIYYSTLLGLFFCCIADGLLVYENMFLWGMITFAIGHIFYQIGLGWNKLKPKIGLVLLAIMGAVMVFIIPHITNSTIQMITPIYGLLLASNVWRSIARASNFIESMSGIGFVLFAISDTALIITRYYVDLKMMGSILIMATYYLAQYFISLGVFANMELSKKVL